MNEYTKQSSTNGNATATKADPKKATPEVVHRMTPADVIKAKDPGPAPLHASKQQQQSTPRADEVKGK